MTDKHKPTPGRMTLHGSCVFPAGIPRKPVVAACTAVSRRPGERQANARLIATAFNAAHACEQMGHDGTASVEALPELLEALGALFALLNVPARMFPVLANEDHMPTDEMCRVTALIRALLAKTKEATT